MLEQGTQAPDFEPKGGVAKLYEVYNEKEGESQRALFVYDEIQDLSAPHFDELLFKLIPFMKLTLF